MFVQSDKEGFYGDVNNVVLDPICDFDWSHLFGITHFG